MVQIPILPENNRDFVRLQLQSLKEKDFYSQEGV